MSKVIVFATPVFLLLIAIEFAVGRWRVARGTGQDTYRLSDAINSISLGILSQVSGVLTRLLNIGIYTAVFSSVALWANTEFWSSWYGVVLALLFYDFCYYWLHRAGHEIAVCWASHVVHHQSQHYNLSTALRQTSTGALLGWIFYLPMAVAGVPPAVFGLVAIIDLLYQFWVHTEQVGKLGWFDRVFCSPSNHRVHHAVNDHYLDRNYGGLLVIWDRMFGSFQEEDVPCVYGTRSPLNSWDPLWANFEVYWSLAQSSWRTRAWGDKLRVWLKPPGWQPADLAERFPKPAFRLQDVTRYNPPLTVGQQWFAAAQFLLTLAAVSAFLWSVGEMSGSDTALWAAAITAMVWAQGRFLQGQLAALEVLMVEASALATLSAIGLLPWHMAFKPLPMVLALLWCGLQMRHSVIPAKRHLLLMGALLFSLGGDVFLMLPGNYFIPGLASFLVAHLFYIVLFRQSVDWFRDRRALVAVGIVGATMYAVLWGPLNDPILRLAVAAYVTVISLMVAQALGRAQQLATPDARWVGLGACIFMASDTLIAINKFLSPITLAPLWILVTYFAAQMLIAHGVQASPARKAAPA